MDRLVVELEHLGRVSQVKMVKRQVPPVVEGEPIVRRPIFGARREPIDAILKPALHLQHVGHRMDRPSVARDQVDRAPAGFLGPTIVSGLLEAESMHAEQIAVARHRFAPLGQNPGNTVAQHGRLAQQKVALVADLQGDGIVRKVDHDLAVERGSAMVVAVEPGPRRGDVAALTVIGSVGQTLGRLDTAPQLRHSRALARDYVQTGTVAETHHEARVLGQGLFNRSQRVIEEALEQSEGLLEALE